MKTICPHCKQEFPDTPDEYLGVTLECPACDKEFICRKAKYCPECGAINPGQAVVCAQCGKQLPGLTLKPVYNTEDSTFDDHGSSVRVSSADAIAGFDKWCIEACVCVGFISFLLAMAVLYPLVTGQTRDLFDICVSLIILVYGCVSVPGAYFINMVTDSDKKIYWTPYRKWILGAFCLLSLILGIGSVVLMLVFMIGGKNRVDMTDLMATFAWVMASFGSVIGWRMFNVRAEEDVDYEEPDTEEYKLKRRLKLMIRIANGCGWGSLIPIGGIVFLPISVVSLIVYWKFGGTECRKAVALCAVGTVIQIVSFCIALA